jgi:hypothetical protein
MDGKVTVDGSVAILIEEKWMLLLEEERRVVKTSDFEFRKRLRSRGGLGKMKSLRILFVIRSRRKSG